MIDQLSHNLVNLLLLVGLIALFICVLKTAWNILKLACLLLLMLYVWSFISHMLPPPPTPVPLHHQHRAQG